MTKYSFAESKILLIEILKLAGPLILSTTGLMMMQFVDAMFLSWYSPDAVAAAIPAGMASWLVITPFLGTCGFVGTFVAHYVGAKQYSKIHNTVWQGIYLSIISAASVALLVLVSEPIYNWVGHEPRIRVLEIQYFNIFCYGAFASILLSTVSGFFSGIGKTRILMYVQLGGFVLNIVLEYLLIFGNFGFPEMGVKGAAIGTVIAQGAIALVLFVLFLKHDKARKESFVINLKLMWRIVRFGLPSGLRLAFEALAWTLFLFIVGRIGTDELAASSIVFRINGIAFFPIIGFGQAVGILVGQAQGRGDPERSIKLTYTGLVAAEAWMFFAIIIFLVFPGQLFGFFNSDGAGAAEFNDVKMIGVVLLRFVAVYSLLDAFNIMFTSSLLSAGDTRWSMMLSIISHCIFLVALLLADYLKAGLIVEWSCATIFVMAMAAVWFFRFKSGKWKNIKIIESIPFEEDLIEPQTIATSA